VNVLCALKIICIEVVDVASYKCWLDQVGSW
jgi:hypothetical protein